MRRPLTVAIAVTAMLAVTVPAWAAWQANGTGTGQSTATAVGVPTSVTAVPTAGAESTSITVSWKAPTSSPTPSSYRVDRTAPTEPAGTNVCPTPTPTGDTYSCNDAGRTAGTSYEYKVYAVLQLWNSTAVSRSATPVQATTAAPVYSATGNPANSPSGNPSIARPTIVAQGSLLIAQVTVEGGSDTNVTSPTGWTLVHRQNYSSDIGLVVYRKVATASEPTSYSFGTGGKKALGRIMSFTGANAGSPIDAVAATGGEGNNTTLSASPVTTTATNTHVVVFHGIKKNTSLGTPTSFTQRYSHGHSGVGYAHAASSRIVNSAGTVQPGDITAGEKEKWVSVTVALKG